MFRVVYVDRREIECAFVGGSSKVPPSFVRLIGNPTMAAGAVGMLSRITETVPALAAGNTETTARR